MFKGLIFIDFFFSSVYWDVRVDIGESVMLILGSTFLWFRKRNRNFMIYYMTEKPTLLWLAESKPIYR